MRLFLKESFEIWIEQLPSASHGARQIQKRNLAVTLAVFAGRLHAIRHADLKGYLGVDYRNCVVRFVQNALAFKLKVNIVCV